MKKLAVIGASYLQKPLLLKAKEMEIETQIYLMKLKIINYLGWRKKL